MALRGVVTAAVLVAGATVSAAPANATPVGPAYVRTACGTMTGPKWMPSGRPSSSARA